MKQEPPFTIKVELTEGCSLYCRFCGIRGIRTGPGSYKFLPLLDAIHIARQIRRSGWNSKIEFAMRGEPTMHPDYIEIVRAFRKALPNTQLMMTSNGSGLLKRYGANRNINLLFNAGLNILLLDDYRHSKFVKAIKLKIVDRSDVTYYPKNGAIANKKHPIGTHRIIIIKDISIDTVMTRKLSNHCGAAGRFVFDSYNKRCARPFRELIIRYDLQVPLCCEDWRGVYDCGSVRNTSLDDIWNSGAFEAQRAMLYHKRRKYAPCYGCNSTSYRVGLLPDKLGKHTMPTPNEKHVATIINRQSHGSMTIPIRRPWEKDSTGQQKK